MSLSEITGEIPIVPAEEAGLSADKLKEVDRFMNKAVADQKLAGGIVAIARAGKIGFFQTYGMSDLEAKKQMTSDTIFRLYSMSKAITSAAALTLVDSGKIALDDPVSKYIPSFGELKVASAEGLRNPSRAMTIRDLMLHTSGLSYGSSGPDAHKEAFPRIKPGQSVDLKEMVQKLSQIPLAFDPGSDWMYSLSIDVLGRVIEIASDQSLDVFLDQTVLKPLGMHDTGFHVPESKVGRFAANYRRTPEGLQLEDAPAHSNFTRKVTLFFGGHGLVGTARDYIRFLMMINQGGILDGKRILEPATVKLMTTNQLPPDLMPIKFSHEILHGTGHGLGFSVRTESTEYNPSGHLGEYGWGGFASTHFWVSPIDDLIVITLEQIVPAQFDTEFGLKAIIYEAIQN